jgi:uncharacterized protein YjbI with pentapeptide repeats
MPSGLNRSHRRSRDGPPPSRPTGSPVSGPPRGPRPPTHIGSIVRTRTVRETRITLPSGDATDLTPLDRPLRPGERLTARTLTGGSWSQTTISETLISHCWLAGADLSATTFTGVTLDRCVITGCNMRDSNWDDVTLRDVIFEDCRLDYSTLTAVTTAGPTAFLRCALTEASITDSKLTRATFDQCRLDDLEIHRCDLSGADLRGNDLSYLAAATALRGVRLEQAQLPRLADGLVHELGITVDQ